MTTPNVLLLAGSGVTNPVILFSDMTGITRPATEPYAFYTMPPDVLVNDGDSISYEISGGFTGAADTELIMEITPGGDGQGGGQLFSTGVVDPSTASTYVVRGRFFRTAAGAYKGYATLNGGGLSPAMVSISSIDMDFPIIFAITQNGTDALAIESIILTYWPAS